jgi:hypothetical protein
MADHPVLPLRSEEENEMPDESRIAPGETLHVKRMRDLTKHLEGNA